MRDEWDETKRAEMLADIERREAMIKRETAMRRWDEAQQAAPVVTRSTPSRRYERQAVTNDITAGWQSYIRREIQDAERRTAEACMAAVGEVLSTERAAREQLESEVKDLREALAELRGRIVEREARRLAVVPNTNAMIG